MIALALMAALALAMPAKAFEAVATGNVNLRMGPGTNHARLTTVPVGAPMLVFGCTASNSWCDVGYGHARGWVSGRYIRPVSYGGPQFQHAGSPVVVIQPQVRFLREPVYVERVPTYHVAPHGWS
jgi:uncharacterized protein YraI